MILFKDGKTPVHFFNLGIGDERSAHTQTVLATASGLETNATHTIIQQFAGKLTSREPGITDGEIESVGNRLIKVFVIYHIELVAFEYFLQFACPYTLDADFATEIILTVAGSLHHGSHGILCTVAGA